MNTDSINFFKQFNRLLFASFTTLILFACSSAQKESTTTISKPSVSKAPQKPVKPLKLCKMHVSNAPSAIDGLINRKSQSACINGLALLIAPAPKSCLSSGYGIRGHKNHNGLDFQSKPAGNIVAASAGKIIDILNRKKDYGHWVIIDHGRGVYSSYAHLESVSPTIRKGERVKQGQRLGKMGKSGKAAKAIHLHYEVRVGDYSNSKKWWGLKPVDIFKHPEKC